MNCRWRGPDQRLSALPQRQTGSRPQVVAFVQRGMRFLLSVRLFYPPKIHSSRVSTLSARGGGSTRPRRRGGLHVLLPRHEKSPACARLRFGRSERSGRSRRICRDLRVGLAGQPEARGQAVTGSATKEKRLGRSRAFLHQFPLEGGPSYQVRESWTMPCRLSSLSISA